MTVNPPPRPLPTELLATYKGVMPATIGHLIDEGFVDTAIRPIYKGVLVLGTAVTLKFEHGDLTIGRYAIEQLRLGDVLIIDNGGSTSTACWGEMTSLAAKMRGCSGVIVDGAVTDILEIEAQQQPTFSRAISALVGRRLSSDSGGVNVPVTCGGVRVHPGDLIVADDNGIVVLPPQRAAEIAGAARAAEDVGPLRRRWLEHGGEIAELIGNDVLTTQRMLEERGWG